MKKIILTVCAAFLLLFMAGCKKESNEISNSLQGLWELRRNSGMLIINYPPGNGATIKFTGDNYEIASNGQITQSGHFTLIKDPTAGAETCLVIPAGQYTDRIVYDNDPGNRKVFIQISGNTLTLLSGCFAYDAGSSSTYERQ